MTESEAASLVLDDQSDGQSSRNSLSKPNVVLRFVGAIFRYRKTSLSFFVLLTLILGVVLSYVDNSLDYSISLPGEKLEQEYLTTRGFTCRL